MSKPWKRIKKNSVVTFVFILLGLIFMFSGFWGYIDEQIFFENAFVTDAKILNITETDDNTYADLEYIIDGETYENRIITAVDKSDIGETIQVYYDVLNPDNIRVPAPIFLYLIMTSVGFIFFLIGVIIRRKNIKRRKLIKKLVLDGNHIWLPITDITFDRSIVVNGKNPYRIKCVSSNGMVFESDVLWKDPRNYLTSMQARVYVDHTDYNKYYVDIDSCLPYNFW